MTKIVVIEDMNGPSRIYCSEPAEAVDIIYYSDDDWGMDAPQNVLPLHQLPVHFKNPLVDSGFLGGN
jgi:hypothetical protein